MELAQLMRSLIVSFAGFSVWSTSNSPLLSHNVWQWGCTALVYPTESKARRDSLWCNWRSQHYPRLWKHSNVYISCQTKCSTRGHRRQTVCRVCSFARRWFWKYEGPALDIHSGCMSRVPSQTRSASSQQKYFQCTYIKIRKKYPENRNRQLWQRFHSVFRIQPSFQMSTGLN